MLGPAEDGQHHVLSGLRSEALFPALAVAENDKTDVSRGGGQ